nr:hypothetical protein CFP56_10490 [Quercus suber]
MHPSLLDKHFSTVGPGRRGFIFSSRLKVLPTPDYNNVGTALLTLRVQGRSSGSGLLERLASHKVLSLGINRQAGFRHPECWVASSIRSSTLDMRSLAVVEPARSIPAGWIVDFNSEASGNFSKP